MGWMEARLNIPEIHKSLTKSLKSRYSYKENSDGIYFKNANNIPFKCCAMGTSDPWNCFVIEYEDFGEDGDLFYPEDYASFDDMFIAITTEIDSV